MFVFGVGIWCLYVFVLGVRACSVVRLFMFCSCLIVLFIYFILFVGIANLVKIKQTLRPKHKLNKHKRTIKQTNNHCESHHLTTNKQTKCPSISNQDNKHKQRQTKTNKHKQRQTYTRTYFVNAYRQTTTNNSMCNHKTVLKKIQAKQKQTQTKTSNLKQEI